MVNVNNTEVEKQSQEAKQPKIDQCMKTVLIIYF